MYQKNTVCYRTTSSSSIASHTSAVDSAKHNVSSRTTAQEETRKTDQSQDQSNSMSSSTTTINPWLAFANKEAPDLPAPARNSTRLVNSPATSSNSQQSAFRSMPEHKQSFPPQSRSSSINHGHHQISKAIRRQHPPPSIIATTNYSDNQKQKQRHTSVSSTTSSPTRVEDMKGQERKQSKSPTSYNLERQKAYLRYDTLREMNQLYNDLDDYMTQERLRSKHDVSVSSSVNTYHTKKDEFYFEPKPNEIEVLFADPPICFCGKVASKSYSLEYGPILECHQYAIKPLSSHTMADNSSASSAATATKPALARLQKEIVCGFHVHEYSWNKIKHDLQTKGRYINSKMDELMTCPLYNYTFCTLFHIKNDYPMKPPAKLPLCFCGKPVVLKAYHRSSDHRRGRHHRGHTFDDDDDVDDDEDNCPLHVQLQFACVNGEVDGAKKCAFVMDAIEVAFDKPSVRMHALVDQETYCSAKQQAREDYFNKLGNQSDSKQALFKEETHHFDEAYINEQKERHMLNLISTLNSHPQQQQQQQQQQGLVEIVPPTFHYPSTANNVVEPSNSQSSSSNCSPPPLQTTSPYTTPPQTPSTATTAVNTPNIMTAVVDTPKKSMPTMLFVPTNVMAKQQQQQQKKLLQRQQSLPQPGLSSSSSTSSSSSYSNHSVHTSSSAPVGPNPLFHIPHPPMPPTNTGTAHTPLSPTATTSSPFSNSCSSSKSSHSSLGHYRLAHLDELSIHQIQKECEVMLNMLKMKEEKFRNTFAEQQTDIYRGRNETVEERFLRKSCQKRLSDLEEDIVKLYNENEVLGNKLHKLEEEERIRREKNDELMNNKCRVCFTRNIEYCLVPCGHYAYCERCVMKLTECAICRHSIDRLQKLYTC